VSRGATSQRIAYLRKDPRYQVSLQVRYRSARDFVLEYAENLSAGGLFVAGATDLEPLQELPVEIELPGAGSFRITAQVAHLVSAEVAARIGRKPGAGLAIIDAPKGFREALSAYLMRLGRRADHLVLCRLGVVLDIFIEAGYQAIRAPEPEQLPAVIARSRVPVVGVVVSSTQAARYRSEALEAGAGDIVHVIDHPRQFDAVLARLDDAL
jgi:hypothetical protein